LARSISDDALGSPNRCTAGALPVLEPKVGVVGILDAIGARNTTEFGES